MKKSKFRSDITNRQRLIASIIVIGIVLVGLHYLVGSHATGPYTSAKADSGTVVSPAAKQTCTGSSDGNCVKFGTASTGGSITPHVPNGTSVPTTVAFDDEFNSGSLDRSKWAPYWFNDNVNQGDGSYGIMKSANVSVDSNGLELTDDSSCNGAIVSSNPNGGASPGFQIQPSAGKPVFVEYDASVPLTGGQMANWAATWLTGQNWPQTGEIDVMESYGTPHYTLIFAGNGPGNNGPGPEEGALVGGLSGLHTYGVLFTTTSVTFYYDGAQVGTYSTSYTLGPVYMVLENRSFNDSCTPGTMTVRYARAWQ